MPSSLLANLQPSDVGQAFVALSSVITPILLVAYYVKQTFFPTRPREEQAMSRAEVEWHTEHLTQRLAALEAEHKAVLLALADVRVQLTRLATLLEETLQRPFRGQ